MKFKKVFWFYETEINGVIYAVQKTRETDKHWECTHNGWIYKGKTRKEAINKAVNEIR